MSRKKLGNAIGVTHQQVSKYESGENRVSASRLSGIAKTLKREPAYFFEKSEFEAPSAKCRAILEINKHLFSLDEGMLYAAGQLIKNLSAIKKKCTSTLYH